jgi:hypothetical protein
MNGQMYVENPQVFEEFLTVDDQIPPSRRFRTNNIIKSNHLEDSKETARQKQIEKYYDTTRRIEANTKRSIERSLKTEKLKKDKKFERCSADVNEAKRFLDEIDENFALQAEAAHNKTRRQFEDWNRDVHGKIQLEISKRIDSKDSKQLNRERCSDFDKFLNITNRKAAIFRDIIIESEYDPLEPNRRAIKATTGRMKDPTLMILMKHEDEVGTLSKKERQQPCRDSLNVELWASGQIEATPYGRFNKMMGIADESHEGTSKNEKSPVSNTMKSSIHFDHYNYPRDKNSCDAEMPKGKRIMRQSKLSSDGLF